MRKERARPRRNGRRTSEGPIDICFAGSSVLCTWGLRQPVCTFTYSCFSFWASPHPSTWASQTLLQKSLPLMSWLHTSRIPAIPALLTPMQGLPSAHRPAISPHPHLGTLGGNVDELGEGKVGGRARRRVWYVPCCSKDGMRSQRRQVKKGNHRVNIADDDKPEWE